MRSANFSKDNLAVQWQYIKSNLSNMGLIYAFNVNIHYSLFLIDGLWIHIKEANELKDKVILFVLGITENNKKEIVAFKLAKGETEEEVTALLNDLYRRGLEGKCLKLIASDGAKGIRSAMNTVYPYAKWQLCYVHKLRNLSKIIGDCFGPKFRPSQRRLKANNICYIIIHWFAGQACPATLFWHKNYPLTLAN